MFVILSFNENTKHFLVNHILHNFASTIGFLSSAFSSPPVARVAQAPALRTVAVAVLLETFLNSTNSCKHDWFPFVCFLIASGCASSSGSSASRCRCRGAPRNLPQLNQLVQARLVSFRLLSHRYSRKKGNL